ncbi:hypothetical protein LCGC14_1821690 [marine sediment metagenome]|uniref:Uncharacterized protein n=1 Tax=marine sediment metagenome TaxID=412755 RepID=A0A0F9GIP6_9ZZZZ
MNILTKEEIIEWVKANALYINPKNKMWQAKLKEWEAQLAKAHRPESRSVQKRIAAQKGEQAPDFSRPDRGTEDKELFSVIYMTLAKYAHALLDDKVSNELVEKEIRSSGKEQELIAQELYNDVIALFGKRGASITSPEVKEEKE